MLLHSEVLIHEVSEFYGIQLLLYFLDVQCTIMIILSEHSWGVSLVKPPKRKAKDK